MKELNMSSSLDLYQAEKVPDQKGGTSLEWKKKMTVYADVNPCQKAVWKRWERVLSFYFRSVEICSDRRYMKIFLQKTYPGGTDDTTE